MLTVYFDTKPEVVEKLLPPPLQPASNPRGFVFVGNYPRTSFGLSYLESAPFLQAEFNGEEGFYCLSMPVLDDMPWSAAFIVIPIVRYLGLLNVAVTELRYLRMGIAMLPWDRSVTNGLTERNAYRHATLSNGDAS